MTSEEIKRYITAVPFVPFYLHVADGRRIPVMARDFILVSPRGRLVDVYQHDDSHDILDIILITSISFDSHPESTTLANPGQMSET